MTRSFMKGCDRMYINITSFIIGGIIWEILKPHICCRLIPEIKRSMGKLNKDGGVKEDLKKPERYKGSVIGFK